MKIGCGLIRIGRKWGISVPHEPPIQSKTEALKFLKGAVDLGITFFDTAPAYGSSEKILGEFLRDNNETAQRLFIATKCGEYSRSDGTTYKDYSPKAIRRSVENSLRLFGGHIGLLQIHSVPEEVLGNEEILRVLGNFKANGSVDLIGVTSSAHPKVVVKAVDMGIFSAVQVPYNLLNRSMEDAMRYASDNQVGVIVNRPLATGLLSSKNIFADEKERDLVRKIQLTQLGIGGTSLTSYAWNFILNNPHVSVALSGTGNLTHLEDNIKDITAGTIQQ